jgi:hypothetical protein
MLAKAFRYRTLTNTGKITDCTAKWSPNWAILAWRLIQKRIIKDVIMKMNPVKREKTPNSPPLKYRDTG